MFNVVKDPDADLDYTIDWSAWLGSDVIATSTWTMPDGSGIEMHDPSLNPAKTQTTVWLRGGTVGGPYRVANHIVTAAGRAEDRSLSVRVQSR